MKKSFVLVSLSAVCAVATMAQTAFRLDGTIPGLKDSVAVVLRTNEGGKSLELATALAVGNHFTLTGETERPFLSKLQFYVIRNGAERKTADLRLMIGSDPIELTIDADILLDNDRYSIEKEAKARYTGSQANAVYQKFLQSTRDVERRADSTSYAESEAYFENKGNEEAIQAYKLRTERARAEWRKTVDDYITCHPNEPVSAALVACKMYGDFDYTVRELDRFASVIRENPDTAHVNFVARNLEKAKRYATGTYYTDFEGLQSSGEATKLSALMQPGKHTLIDFWASWCGPCRRAIPKVKALTEKYSGQLQVISVSVDKRENDWRRAEKEEAMPWPQLWIGGDMLDKPVDAYNIQSIPRLVLIAPDGGIAVATFDPDVVARKLLQVYNM